MNTLYDVIKKSRLTEKGNKLQETQNTVVFTVAGTANKIQIKAAVEKLFKARPADDGGGDGGDNGARQIRCACRCRCGRFWPCHACRHGA